MRKDILFVVIQFLLFAIYFGMESEFIDFRLPEWFRMLCILFVIVGLVVIFFGLFNLNKNLSAFPTPKQNATLVSVGIYKYVRHPIYTGMLVGMTSYGLYMLSAHKVTVSIVLMIVLYFKSNLEEKLLIERYAQYKEYVKTTGRFLPKLRR